MPAILVSIFYNCLLPVTLPLHLYGFYRFFLPFYPNSITERREEEEEKKKTRRC